MGPTKNTHIFLACSRLVLQLCIFLSCQDIDKNSTDINRHKVQVVTGQEMVKKLTKAIDESRKEQERVVAEKEKMVAVFKEIEQKAFIVQENYKRTQEVLYSCHTKL